MIKEKKSAVITLRTTEEINEWLENKAEEKGWTKAQLTENIIRRYVYEEDDKETDEAKEIIKYINENKCDISDLTKWAIETGKFETFRLGLEVWKTFIDNQEKKQNKHGSYHITSAAD